MDEKKRDRILEAAAERFAAQPFHKVRMNDVAQAAGVGKGTLYTYFKSKDDLYLYVLYNGFSRLLERLRSLVNEGERQSLETLRMTIDQMVQFAFENPHLFELMRTASGKETFSTTDWRKKHTEFRSLLESIIHRGIERAEIKDAHPELTARFIPGLVRSVMIESAFQVNQKTLTDHVFHFVKSALTREPW